MTPRTFAEGTSLEDLQLLRFVDQFADLEFWEGARRSADGGLTRLSLKLTARGARADAEQRLRREVSLAAGLAHPGVLRLLGHRQPHGIDVVLAEPIEGPSLAELQSAVAARRQRLPAFATMELLQELARALAGAWRARDPHGRPLRIVHRALTPTRVFLNPAGQSVLTDWSSAGTGVDRAPRAPAWSLDEARYAAPELDASPAAAGPAIDLFSFGVIAWELACTRPFVQGATVQEVRQLILRRAPEQEVSQVPSGLADLADLLVRLLQRDPARRLAHPAELLQAVDRLAEQTPPGMNLRRVVAALSSYRPPISAPPERGPAAPVAPQPDPSTQDWSAISMDEIRAAREAAERPKTEDWSAISMDEIRAAKARAERPKTEDWSAISMDEIRAAKEAAERPKTEDWSAISMDEIRAAKEAAERPKTEDWSAISMDEIRAARDRARKKDR